MKAISNNPFAAVLVALFATFLLASSVSFAWGEETNEVITEEMGDFIGPRLLGSENQSEGNANEALEPTEGWEAIGTCEWRIDENRCLVIRPIDKSTNYGVLPSIRDGREAPWGNKQSSIFAARFEGSIKASEYMVLFGGCYLLRQIEGLSNLDTSDVKSFGEGFTFEFGEGNVRGLFSGCMSLESVDLSSFQTANAESMSGMFSECESLKELDVSGFDTCKVKDMSGMFSGCISLERLDLGNFDTSNVEDMSRMFFQGYPDWDTREPPASSLKSIDLSSFVTNNVTNMEGMFAYCIQLESLDVSHFNTSRVERFSSYDGRGMFEGCAKLKALDVTNFDTSGTTDGSWCQRMFYGCAELEQLDLKNWNTSKAERFGYMFAGCESLKKLDLSSFNTFNVVSMQGMFEDCHELTEVDLSSFRTDIVSDVSRIFYGCSSLESVDLSHFETSLVSSMEYAFAGCTSLKTLDVSNFDTSTAAKYASSNTNIFDDALEEITLGAKYTLSNSLPDKKWYNSRGDAFESAAAIPVGVADTYTAAIPISSIKIEAPASTLLDIGGSVQLKATIEPANTTESIVWGTYDDGIVAVDQNGYVTALEAGYATVYASDGIQYSSIRDAIQINVNKRVNGISISETAKVIKLSDGPFSLEATVTPADAFNGAIAWSSSNTAVATVDATGMVVPKQVGTATITASAGTMTAHCLLTVLESDEDVIPVESITLDATTKSLSGKATARLNATVTPSDATYGAVRWTSSNESVATVDGEGLITSTGKGTATVVATSLDGKKSAMCEVTVTNPPTGLAFAASPVQLKIGESARISFSATGELSGATEEISGIQWSISDRALASLQENGKQATISGKSVGDVRIDVRARYGNSELATATDMSIVWADAEQVVLNETKKTVLVGHEPIELQANVKPDSAAGTTVQWSSSDPSVASVDQGGVIAIHHAGNAVIYARAGSVSASCSIEVQPKSVPSSDDSDVDGFISLEDSELAEELDGLSFRIKDSERRSDGSLQNSVLSNVGEGSSVLDIYEMDFIDGNGDVKPWHSADYQLTVHVAKSDELKSLADAFYPTVHYVGENAQAVEAKKTWTEGDDVVFQTNHFSTYAISASPVPQDVAGNSPAGAKPEANQTRVGSLVNSGDSFGAVGIAFGGVALLAAVAGLTLFLRRRSG